MDKPAIIEGNYVDLRFMPGLKCARVSIDINIEESNVFLEMFRAPDRASPVRVVIARLAEQSTSRLSGDANNDIGPDRIACEPKAARSASPRTPDAEREGQDKPRTPFRDMPRSQQAALKCQDLEFQRWLRATNPKAYELVDPDWNEAKMCDYALKLSVVIHSKKDLDEIPGKGSDWDKLLTAFDTRAYAR